MRVTWPALLLLAAATAVADPSPLAWELVSGGGRPVFWANRNHDLSVVVRNVGTETWSEATGDHLSYHWLSPDGRVVVKDGLRANLPQAVAPGEIVTFSARVAAPTQTGRWILAWEMVREQVRWYGSPAGRGSGRHTVLVAWRCSFLQVAFAVVAIGVPLALRRAGREGIGPTAHAVLPVLLA